MEKKKETGDKKKNHVVFLFIWCWCFPFGKPHIIGIQNNNINTNILQVYNTSLTISIRCEYFTLEMQISGTKISNGIGIYGNSGIEKPFHFVFALSTYKKKTLFRITLFKNSQKKYHNNITICLLLVLLHQLHSWVKKRRSIENSCK